MGDIFQILDQDIIKTFYIFLKTLENMTYSCRIYSAIIRKMIKEDKMMNYQFQLTEQGAQPVLAIRTRTSVEKLPEEIGKAYGQIMEYLKEVGQGPVEVPYCAYYNLDMEDLDVEMGFPVVKGLEGKGNIVSTEIPAGKQVSCLFKGPYKDMEGPYNAMAKWLNENGHTPTGVSYEFYYNSPMDVPESELLTKIVFPIK